MSICDITKCTGCMACYNACPKHCITMVYDENGTLNPQIQDNICSGCNICSTVCPVNKTIEFTKPMETYACWNLDEDKRKSSSSGGIASTFYEYFVENGGIVYGCFYDENLQLKFSKATTIEELQKFKTSKYSQAYIGEIYKEIFSLLIKNEKVLFIGTPCQVAGLKSYLRKDYDNLLTVDLICHGVPSQKFIDEYIKSLDLEVSPNNLTFRGIYDFYFTLYKNSDILYSKKARDDAYYSSFLNGLFYRESCYDCKYAKSERISDITIGDFWGLGEKIPFESDTSNGVSVALINTEKGNTLFNNIKNKIFFEKRTIEEAIAGNDQLRHPSIKNENYEKFKELYKKYGFENAIKECFKNKEVI